MTADRPDAPIETPCIRVCKLDRTSRLCIGCLRSMDEIGAWTRMSPEERRRVMDELPVRKDLIGRR